MNSNLEDGSSSWGHQYAQNFTNPGSQDVQGSDFSHYQAGFDPSYHTNVFQYNQHDGQNFQQAGNLLNQSNVLEQDRYNHNTPQAFGDTSFGHGHLQQPMTRPQQYQGAFAYGNAFATPQDLGSDGYSSGVFQPPDHLDPSFSNSAGTPSYGMVESRTPTPGPTPGPTPANAPLNSFQGSMYPNLVNQPEWSPNHQSQPQPGAGPHHQPGHYWASNTNIPAPQQVVPGYANTQQLAARAMQASPGPSQQQQQQQQQQRRTPQPSVSSATNVLPPTAMSQMQSGPVVAPEVRFGPSTISPGPQSSARVFARPASGQLIVSPPQSSLSPVAHSAQGNNIPRPTQSRSLPSGSLATSNSIPANAGRGVPQTDQAIPAWGNRQSKVPRYSGPDHIGQANRLGWHAGAPNLSKTNQPFAVADSSRGFRAPKAFKFQNSTGVPLRVLPSGPPLPCEFIWQFEQASEQALEDHKQQERLEKGLRDRFRHDKREKALPDKLLTVIGPNPRAGKRTTSSVNGTAVQQSDSDTSEYTDSEDDEEVPPIPEKCPSDPLEQARWKAINILWVPKSDDSLTQDRVAKLVGKFGELVCDNLNLAIKDARAAYKAKSTEEKANVLRKAFQPLHRAVSGALQHGNDWVLSSLGTHKKLNLVIMFVLQDAKNLKDFNTAVSKSLLRLMSRMSNLPADVLEKFKFPQLAKKLWIPEGDDEVKELVNKVLAIAGAKSKPPGEQAKAGTGVSSSPYPEPKIKATSVMESAHNPAAKGNNGISKMATEHSTSKRPRDDDSDLRTSKKIAVDGTASPSRTSKQAAPTKATPISSQSSMVAKARPTGLLPGKSRPVAKPAPKPDANKSELLKTAIAKPDLSKLVAAKKKPVDPSPAAKTVSKAAAARGDGAREAAPNTPGSQSSISALLDMIGKKPAVSGPGSSKDKDGEIQETPEEKARRLRKEERRKLRVTWKSDDELTQVRVFHKEAAEEEGRTDNMIRDARDDRSEGMVLKQSKESNNVDEDEDDEPPYRPWEAPTAIDFSAIPHHKRDTTFVTRGGNVSFHTDQQKFMEDREKKELMVIYTDPSDIPPTPRSPSSSHETSSGDGPAALTLPNTTPELQEIHHRWAEMSKYGDKFALYNARQRLQTRPKVPSASSEEATRILDSLGSLTHRSQPTTAVVNPAGVSTTPPTAPQPTMMQPAHVYADPQSEVYRLLISNKLKTWQSASRYDQSRAQTQRRQDHSDPEVQKAAEICEDIINLFRGKPAAPAEPPEWIRNKPQRVQEWQDGYNRDQQRKAKQEQEETARKQAEAFDAARAQAQAQAQAASQQTQPYGSQNATDLAAYIAYYNQYAQQHQAPQQQAPQQTQQNPYSQYYGTNAQQPQPAQAQDQNSQIQALMAVLSGNPQAQALIPNLDGTQIQALMAAMGTQGNAAGHQSQQYSPAPAQAGPIPQDAAYQQYLQGMAQQFVGQQQQEQGVGNRDVTMPDPTAGQGSHGYDYGAHQQRDQHERDPPRNERRRNKGGGGGSGGGGGDSNVPPHLRGINRDKIGTKPCLFWQKGQCAKGDKCTFRHD